MESNGLELPGKWLMFKRLRARQRATLKQSSATGASGGLPSQWEGKISVLPTRFAQVIRGPSDARTRSNRQCGRGLCRQDLRRTPSGSSRSPGAGNAGPTGGDSAADAIVTGLRRPHWPPPSRVSRPRQYRGTGRRHKSPSWCHPAAPPAILETKLWPATPTPGVG
jgi:hypothetical protein